MAQLGPQTTVLDRAEILERFAVNRTRTRMLFDLLDEGVYYDRPITLRNPVVFYEGHIPAFSFNTLIKKALGGVSVDAHLETIFARGIDPESEATAVARGNPAWPSRATVHEFADEADRRIEDAIRSAELDRPGHPLLEQAQAVWTVLEHEEMHQETLAYIWHQVPYGQKRIPDGYSTPVQPGGAADVTRRVRIPAGRVTLGTDLREAPFAWDNECPVHRVGVGEFEIDAYNVTNGQFLEFVRSGGYRESRWWRPADWEWVVGERRVHPPFWERAEGRWWYHGMFERIPLPESWPVYVTWAEASAYARWRGRRLPTEAEYHRAAFGTTGRDERQLPWGDGIQDVRGNYDFERWDPVPVGSRPEGASAFGVHDLIGNGWEWTGSLFEPFDGFTPLASYPEYSADFFDANHFVMKGASPVTSRALVRRGFRNWFRPCYPYVYATFRCVEAA